MGLLMIPLLPLYYLLGLVGLDAWGNAMLDGFMGLVLTLVRFLTELF